MMYDEEQMIKDLEALFKAKLNDAIDCVNIQRNDDWKIPHIADDKYVFETIDKSILNFTGFFIMFGIVSTGVPDQNQNSYIENLTVSFEVGTFDEGPQNRRKIIYRLMRYRRALKSVILNNPQVFRNYAKPLVTGLNPTAFEFENKVILKMGVDISASATAM